MRRNLAWYTIQAVNPLLRTIGRVVRVEEADRRPAAGWVPACLLVILLGSGAYGATLGSWRSGLQGWFVALKLPLLMLLTTGGTGLLNWMIATRMGLRMSFAASLRTTLSSFALVSLVLGSLSPITLFLLGNVPPLGSPGTRQAYSSWMLAHVAIIAVAGIAAHQRIYRRLAVRAGSAALAARVLLAWLIANLFVGSQLSWNFRPFIGAPHLPVQFLRPNAFAGNFYEAVYRSARTVLTPIQGATP